MEQIYNSTIAPHLHIRQQLLALRMFLLVWIGQLISLTGSSMSSFALGVWVFQRTGSVTNFALTLLFSMLPRAVLAPVAGVLADRVDRRTIIIVANIGAGLTTLTTAALFMSQQLAVWHIYLFSTLYAGFGTLQGPALGAAVTQLVPRAHYGRANGLMQLGQSIGQVAAPVLAGILIATIELQGVLLIDMATFLVAVLTILPIRLPRPAGQEATPDQPRSWLGQLREGWCFLWTRPGLLGLVATFAIVSFFVGVAEAALTPLILSFAAPATLGGILSAGGVGMLLGSVLMSTWGGGQRKVDAVFGAYAMLGLGVLLVGAAPSVPLATAGIVLAFFCLPTVMGASQAILQIKVPPEIQGRVFALNSMLNTLAFALAYLIGGPLADRVFEPLLAATGPLAGNVGALIGIGPGRGMGLLFVVMGALAMLTALSAFLHPRIRNVEVELPDVGAQ